MGKLHRFGGVAVVVALAVGFTFADHHAKEAGWFDMDNCEICAAMADHKADMMRVKWETHKLENGLLSISVVPEDLKPAMDKAHKQMEKTIKRVEAGEEMHLCGYCQSLGHLMGHGAKKEELDTVGGHIFMLTSDKPEVVKEIHQHVDKSLAEFKKMMSGG